MIARVPSRRLTPGGEPDVQEDLDQDRGRLRPVAWLDRARPRAWAGEVPPAVRDVLEARCLGCHDGASKKGGLDLSAPEPNFADAEGFARWAKVYDRVESGEMPPKGRERPTPDESRALLGWLDRSLTEAEDARLAASGRSALRRLTRAGVREHRPRPPRPARRRARGPAAARRLGARLRQERRGPQPLARQPRQVHRGRRPRPRPRHRDPAHRPGRPEIAAVAGRPGGLRRLPVDARGRRPPPRREARPRVSARRQAQAPRPGGPRGDRLVRDREHRRRLPARGGVGQPLLPRAHHVRPGPVSRPGLVLGVPVGQGAGPPGPPDRGRPALGGPAHRRRPGGPAPELHPRLLRRALAATRPSTSWTSGSTATRSWGSTSPRSPRWRTTTARATRWPSPGPGSRSTGSTSRGRSTTSGRPGRTRSSSATCRSSSSSPNGIRASASLRGTRLRWLGLGSLSKNQPDPVAGTWTVRSEDPAPDADRLLAAFLPRAFRRPVAEEVRRRYVERVERRLKAGDCFETAMRSAVPRGALLARLPPSRRARGPARRPRRWPAGSRISCGTPRPTRRSGRSRPRANCAGRTSSAPRPSGCSPTRNRGGSSTISSASGSSSASIAANDPDRKLYPEFNPYLQDSMVAETHAYFRELLDRDLDIGHLVRSDFAMLNEALADHYGIPGVSGPAIRRVALPPDCPRGGLLTQASILKVTANGTTTSPVPRGAFVIDRLLGRPPEPPPASVPAVEPDVRGATTIREQLAKHRNDPSCAGCHAKIDPPGFALESFDVIGGFRTRYRSLENGDPAPRGKIDPFIGIGFRLGPPVDPSGALPDGRPFRDIRELQARLADDRRDLAEEPRPAMARLLDRPRARVPRPQGPRRDRVPGGEAGRRRPLAPARSHPGPALPGPMKTTLALIPALLIGFAAGPAPAAEARVKCRITGLFQPDRVDDLRRQGGTLRLRRGGRLGRGEAGRGGLRQRRGHVRLRPRRPAPQGRRGRNRSASGSINSCGTPRGAPSRPSRRAPCRPTAGERSGSAWPASTARGAPSAPIGPWRSSTASSGRPSISSKGS